MQARFPARSAPRQPTFDSAISDPLRMKWRIAEPPPEGLYSQLNRAAPANNLRIASWLLHNRGLHTDAEVSAFLRDDISALQDPLKIPGMSDALNVIGDAIAHGERIGILGDFDADGITATAILMLALRRVSVAAEFQLPNREAEGHGISAKALDEFHRRGVKLVITVDVGISDFSPVDYANSLGMKVVITDHHKPERDRLPAAAAIVNHHLSSADNLSDYCGSATAFMLANALLNRYGKDDLGELIPLAAIGTLADKTMLLGDNRLIVREGLKTIDAQAPPGLRELVRFTKSAVNHEGPYTADFINFQVSPRLNAPGRLSTADPSLELLIADDILTARGLVSKLEEANMKRRRLAESARKDAKEQIASAIEAGRRVISVRLGPDYPAGVFGPLAGSISERVGLPAFVFRVDDGIARASARSVPGFDFHHALSGFADRLIRFGGHAAAAGFTVREEDLPALKTHLETMLSWADLSSHMEGGVVKDADCEVELHQLGRAMWDFIEKMSPFGPGNPEPIFVIRGATYSDIKKVGRNGNHLRMMLSDYTQTRIGAFGFNIADRLPSSSVIDVVASLRVNHFRGRRIRELHMFDIYDNGASVSH